VPAPGVCVIFNPAAGRGRAPERVQTLRRSLGERAVFQPTESPGHAEELARKAAAEGFATVGAAGGDGTVHEVANGLLRAGRPEVALAVFPVGSANDYAFSLGLGPDWWLNTDPLGSARAVDVGLVRTPDGRERHFVNGIGIGFNGAVTMESRRIRRLQGVPLYTLALLRALVYHYRRPLVTATIDGAVRRVPTLAFSVAIGCREGNFKLAPNAVVDDGQFDYLQAGALPRWELLRYVPGMITGNLPTDHPALWRGRCRHVILHSEDPLPVHLDGEVFCEPSDGVRDLDIQIVPGALRVQGLEARTGI
jgi:diacylglycerol kinase (ATP)